MAKKELKCKTCKYCINDECTHQSNTLIVVKNRRENIQYIKDVKDLEKSCKNYNENGI